MLEIGILTDEISLDLDEALAKGKSLGFRKYELRCVDSYDLSLIHISEPTRPY